MSAIRGLDFTRTDDYAHLLDSMDHEGVLFFLNQLVEENVPAKYIMAELVPEDYRDEYAVSLLIEAGADLLEIIKIVGPDNMLMYWGIRSMAKFYDEKAADVMLELFSRDDPRMNRTFVKFLELLDAKGKKIPPEKLEKFVCEALEKDARPAESLLIFEDFIDVFLNVGLDVNVAMEFAQLKTMTPGVVRALLDHDIDPEKVLGQIDAKLALVMSEVFQQKGVKLDYQALIPATGSYFMRMTDVLLTNGVNPQWLADQVTEITVRDTDVMRSLILAGVKLEKLLPKIDPTALMHELSFLQNVSLCDSFDFSQYVNDLLKGKFAVKTNDIQHFLESYATMLAKKEIVPVELLLSKMESASLEYNFEKMWELFEGDPEKRQLLLQNTLKECPNDTIPSVVGILMKESDSYALIESGEVTQIQVRELWERYIDIKKHPTAVQCYALIENLGAIKEFCPELDLQAYIDAYPEWFQPAIVENIWDVLEHGIKFDADKLLRKTKMSNEDKLRCVLALANYGYDINWCLKRAGFEAESAYKPLWARSAGRIFSPEEIKKMLDLGANRDLLAYIYYSLDSYTGDQKPEEVFGGPLIWTKLTDYLN